jgi:hypothetical protein
MNSRLARLHRVDCSYGIQAIFNGMTSRLNFIKYTIFFKRYFGRGAHTQTGKRTKGQADKTDRMVMSQASVSQ